MVTIDKQDWKDLKRGAEAQLKDAMIKGLQFGKLIELARLHLFTNRKRKPKFRFLRRLFRIRYKMTENVEYIDWEALEQSAMAQSKGAKISEIQFRKLVDFCDEKILEFPDLITEDEADDAIVAMNKILEKEEKPAKKKARLPKK